MVLILYLTLLLCYSTNLATVLGRAGIKNTTTHSVRHGGASFLASLGIPLSKIKERGAGNPMLFCYLTEPLDSKIRSDFLVAERLE